MTASVTGELEPAPTLPEDEFWRDVEATNRCDDPKKAKQFLSSLIVRRAQWEAIEYRMPDAVAECFVQSRARELWFAARSRGFPHAAFLGVVTVNFQEMP
jgi:hypothetical protein